MESLQRSQQKLVASKTVFHADLLNMQKLNQLFKLKTDEPAQTDLLAKKSEIDRGISTHLDKQIDYTLTRKRNTVTYKMTKGPQYDDYGILKRSLLGSQNIYDDYIRLRQSMDKEGLQWVQH